MMPNVFLPTKRIWQFMLLSVTVIVVITVIIFSFSSCLGGQGKTQAPSKGPSPIAASPLLFGTNIDLLDKKNTALTSQAVRNALTSLPVRIVRMPVHSDASESAVKQAVDYVVNGLKSQLLLNLRDLSGPDALKDQERIVQAVKQAAGNKLIYYEYGNEDDLYGLPAEQYSAIWNQMVPALKRLAPQSQVIGPATYHYDGAYLRAFLQRAVPRPDAVSWHEYTCDGNSSTNECLQHLNDWKEHADAARQVMKAVTGKELPIMITEWNYTPETSPQSDDESFVRQWTSMALMDLARAGVTASMQFPATKSAIALVKDDGTLTVQGKTLQKVYLDFSLEKTPQPEDVNTPMPTNTPTPEITPTPVEPTATQVPLPTPTPTPIHVPSDPSGIYNLATSGTPMYTSSLAAQDKGNWSELQFSDGGYCKFASGGYHAYEPVTNYYAPCMSGNTYPADFALQVTVTISKGGNEGIIVRSDDVSGYNNECRLRIGVDGAYDVVNKQTTMATGNSAAFKKGVGQHNVVTIVGYKTTLFIYFNKTFVKSIPNATRHSGKIGFFALDWGSPTEVVFQNLKLWQLNWP